MCKWPLERDSFRCECGSHAKPQKWFYIWARNATADVLEIYPEKVIWEKQTTHCYQPEGADAPALDKMNPAAIWRDSGWPRARGARAPSVPQLPETSPPSPASAGPPPSPAAAASAAPPSGAWAAPARGHAGPVPLSPGGGVRRVTLRRPHMGLLLFFCVSFQKKLSRAVFPWASS